MKSLWISAILFVLAALLFTIPANETWQADFYTLDAVGFSFLALFAFGSWVASEIRLHQFHADYRESSRVELVRMVSNMTSEQIRFARENWPVAELQIRAAVQGAIKVCYVGGEPVPWPAVVEIMEQVTDEGYLPGINDNELQIAKRRDLELVGKWLVESDLAVDARGNEAPRLYDWDTAARALGVVE